MTDRTDHKDIRIGTLVPCNRVDPIAYIKEILPHGFESFQLFFWGTLGGMDLSSLAEGLNEALEGTDAVISSLGLFGNPMDTEPQDEQCLKDWQTCIDAAPMFGCDVVAGFTGRLRGRSIDENIPRFREVWTPLAERAEANKVRIAFENCPMEGTWETGDWNIAHNPAAWELMFDAVPSEYVGLEWEPCHQMTQLIEPIPQIKDWCQRFVHVHGKDATILWDVIARDGIGGKTQFVYHRTPGFGDSDWKRIITLLRMHGYTGTIDIEGWHDPVYRGDLEMTGQVLGLNYLKECRGGAYYANPT